MHGTEQKNYFRWEFNKDGSVKDNPPCFSQLFCPPTTPKPPEIFSITLASAFFGGAGSMFAAACCCASSVGCACGTGALVFGGGSCVTQTAGPEIRKAVAYCAPNLFTPPRPMIIDAGSPNYDTISAPGQPLSK